MSTNFKYLLVLLPLFLFVGCGVSQDNLSIKKEANLPSNYINTIDDLKIKENWLLDLNNTNLENIVNKALNNNYRLKQLSYDISIKKENLIGAKSYLLPALDLSLNHIETGDFDNSVRSGLGSVSLNLSYEVDIWGKLSDSSKKTHMQILESQALYEQAKQQLVLDVCIAYYNIVESNKLLELYKKNLVNATNNYEIVYKRYLKGLGSVLDIYQTKNIVHEQISRVSAQETIKLNAIFTLKRYLGKYTDHSVDVSSNIPEPISIINVGLPSDLVLKKQSLLASWNKLLAKSYELAFVHKQRLPSFNLSASLERTSISGVPFTWSILSGISAPIFNAGRLRANEEIARLELKKVELEYLDNVYNSYIDVESKITQNKNLLSLYNSLLVARTNAKIASELSFKQYLKGLVEYSTVLDNQNKYYNSQALVIQIKKQLLENRINLHYSLGGDFSSSKPKTKESSYENNN